MASNGEPCIRYLFGESLPSDDDEKVDVKLDEKAVSKPSIPSLVGSSSLEKTSSKETAAKENATQKVTHEEIPKKTDYKEYLDLSSLLTHMPTYKAVAPRIISLIVSDLQSRRLRRTTKDEVLSAALSNGLKCQNLTRRRFATYDLLLPTKEECEALARKVLVHEQLRIQTEYRGRRLIRVTLCKAPKLLGKELVSVFFQQHGEVVSVSSRVSRIGFPYLEWDLQLYVDREGFDSIPELFMEQGLRLPIIVEGRRPLCWNCSRMGHLSADCLNKKTPSKLASNTIPNNRTVYRGRPGVRSTNAYFSDVRSNSGVYRPSNSKTAENAPQPTNRNRLRFRQRARLTSLSSC